MQNDFNYTAGKITQVVFKTYARFSNLKREVITFQFNVYVNKTSTLGAETQVNVSKKLPISCGQALSEIFPFCTYNFVRKCIYLKGVVAPSGCESTGRVSDAADTRQCSRRTKSLVPPHRPDLASERQLSFPTGHHGVNRVYSRAICTKSLQY